jgi:uncharacterized protein (TIGR03083 family)
MDQSDFMEALVRETAAMQVTVEAADPGSRVPTCPGWTVRDLVIHTGQVYRHKTVSVRDNWDSGAPPWPGEPQGDLIAWFNESLDAMLAVFREADLDAPTWTWCAHEHAVEWWVRRMAHETLIHGVDAVIATGGAPLVDETLAEDGIEEILFEMMAGAPSWAELTEGDRMVSLTIPESAWTLRVASWTGVSPGTGKAYVDEPTVVLVSGTADPDAVVAGTAAELDLWLWGRRDLPAGAVSGDASLADLVRSIASEATQ